MQDAHALIASLPEYPRWGTALEAHGLTPHRPALEALLRPTIALDGVPVPPDEADRLCSRLGGLPDVPAGFEWPTWRGEPLTFLAQLVLDEALLALDHEAALPRGGVLSLFAFLGAPDHASVCALRWFPADELKQGLTRRAPPADSTPRPWLALPRELRLVPRLALSMPAGGTEPVRAALPDDDAYDAYHDEVWLALRPPAPDHRLLGWPNASSWLDERNARFLLQIDSDDRVGLEMGDVETLRVHVEGLPLDERRLALAQCTLDEG